EKLQEFIFNKNQFKAALCFTVTHSLQYFYTGVTPGINFPEFTAVGQVDGGQFVYYDSNIRKMIPKTEWIQRNEGEDYWNSETQNLQKQEIFKVNVATAMQRFNQTEGVHTVQVMYGCELDDDGTVRGYDQFGYDGEDFISFDLKTLTWIAPTPQALITKNKWDNNPGTTVNLTNYLENTCTDWLKKYVSYGRETLERKDPPTASVFQKHSPYPEVVCHATGFFPKEVNISWRKDGEDVYEDVNHYVWSWYEDVELRETLPNQDGSFQKRSILKVPAEELQKHTYTCVIQHSSLEEELVLEVPKGSGFSLSFTLIAVFGAGIFLFVLIFVIQEKIKSRGVKEEDDQILKRRGNDDDDEMDYSYVVYSFVSQLILLECNNIIEAHIIGVSYGRETLERKGMEHSSVLPRVLIFLVMAFPQASAATHSLQYFYTGVTPGINFPEFIAVGLLDGEQFMSYDSNIRKMIPKTEWIQKISTDDPDYWKNQTHDMQSDQEKLKQLLVTVMKDFNQTEVVHTLQRMFGCELDDDNTTRGYDQYGYDGEDFISLDLNTGNWTAATPQADIIKRKWDNDPGFTVDQRNYLEKECIECLKKFVSYGRETLERKVRPEASVFQEYYFSPEVVCHATGFFPKAVMISWRKDGEDVNEDVELRETLPNQDGSFQKRSILKVPAEELQKHNYTCVIQHSSLEEELVLPVGTMELEIIECDLGYHLPVDYLGSDEASGGGSDEASGEGSGGGSGGGEIAIIIGAAVVLVASVAGFVIWKKRKMSDLFSHVPLGSDD
ncbi:hypothetical protein QTP86_015713, partial [Hemibagrus guttatus]